LARWHKRVDTGIFGPFGVSAKFRGSPIGRNLLGAALARLRQIGYDFALIPAVSGEPLIGYYIKNCGAQVVERFGVDRMSSGRVRTTVLASGNGTNLQAVLDGASSGTLPVDVAAVITNNEAAFALQRARTAGVQNCQAFPWNKADEMRSAYDRRLSDAVERTEPELVLLLGWMHVLPGSFIEFFSEIINIHPAFLPLDQGQEEVVMPDGSIIRAYRGAHAIRDALADRSSWIGATAHKVTEQADRGTVLARKPQPIKPSTAAELVRSTLRPVEHRVLRDAIMRWVFEQRHTLSPV
ncbi:MAG: hypothetical protein M3Z14_04745, partial [Candidatus Eremiobacteraeota bacterium]|nr:hypothetical protein [Candidatus Eremiobacteraeota bacterium]